MYKGAQVLLNRWQGTPSSFFPLCCNLPQGIGWGCLGITSYPSKHQLHFPYTRPGSCPKVTSMFLFLGFFCKRKVASLSVETANLEYYSSRNHLFYRQLVRRQDNRKLYYVEEKNYRSITDCRFAERKTKQVQFLTLASRYTTTLLRVLPGFPVLKILADSASLDHWRPWPSKAWDSKDEACPSASFLHQLQQPPQQHAHELPE